MSGHLNRLDNKEAFAWDEAYAKFCETGEWEEPNDSLPRRSDDGRKHRKT